MYCTKCGNPLNEGAVFCPKCGAKTEALPVGTTSSPVAESKTAKNKKIMIGAIAGAVVLIALIAVMMGGAGVSATQIENRIAELTADVPANAEEIVALYGDYEKLSESKKKKVTSSETLISAYNQATGIIDARKAKAVVVDALIAQIDTTNEYAKASTVKDAVAEWNKLDDYERNYVAAGDTLRTYHEEIKDLDVAVTSDNFYRLYTLKYEVGEMEDAVEGSENYSDLYIPVYVTLLPNYPNLANECSFYIHLHQTYDGIGVISSETQEYYRQSSTIEYDSSMGAGGCIYTIPVDNMSSNGGFLDNLFNIHELFHSMNDFDESRVEIKNVTGHVKY